METKANVLWTTDTVLIDEWDTAQNVELSYDKISRCTRIRVISKKEREDPTSLSRLLTPSDSLEMAAALITAARKQLEAEE